ncbi:hypothetical protein, conserved [Trypanosoma brucei brucei TREU927]|uniref:C5orf34-like C-terminal domain-containing protein n=1 Tax=Trypanosoma brucei brucei (strain 927/4 GUTat10.1) TaxID=185431 RepID=Q586X3_TRYB2|nr:hypothetical protein, conserved [Trypanosoma brucei brucei TREU927]AAQ15832.1 hypothetical protein, conserved [Trypanosoma brucei brucei TREU927]AAX79618.1 hypothetical protein, conserved [Trypanosoma brucei]
MSLRRFYNEVSVADHVVKACAWTDSSVDFVYGDGTVLSFCDEMQTFVAIDGSMGARSRLDISETGDEGKGGDYYFTALTLSKYEKKVSEALQIYNYYSPHPRVISGLTVTPCEVWRHPGPIDSLVVAVDRRLFERCGSRATLWCALRRVSLTLHGGRMTFSVRWPAPAVERSGARSIFVRPTDSRGFITGTVDSLRAFHYVWMEQTFPLIDPPREWIRMLEVALQFDEELPADHTPAEAAALATEDEECRMYYETTPRTAQDHKPCRFSSIRYDHVHALIANPQMQNAMCNGQIRNPRERVVWRYDADPMGRVPHAIYWGLGVCETKDVRHSLCLPEGRKASWPNSGVNRENTRTVDASATSGPREPYFVAGSVLCMIREDESVALVEPIGESYVVHHWRRSGGYKVYHQSADGLLGLPPVIPPEQHEGPLSNNGNSQLPPEDPSSPPVPEGEYSDGVVMSRAGGSLLYFSSVLEEAPFAVAQRGRYLPEVGGSCIEISQRNIAAARVEKQREMFDEIAGFDLRFALANGADRIARSATACSTSGLTIGPISPSDAAEAAIDRTQMRMVSDDPAINAAATAGSVVFLTSAIDGIGTFAALTNGTVRCHFDDRTILYLIPGGDDKEENLVATCLFRDATQCSIRLSKCLNNNPMFQYVAYALRFRRFVRLSPEARNAVVEGTNELKLQFLEETEWQQTNQVERNLQALFERTRELLDGSDKLCRTNRSLLNRDDSTYFT